MPKPLPDREMLDQLFELDAVEGVLIWRHRPRETIEEAVIERDRLYRELGYFK